MFSDNSFIIVSHTNFLEPMLIQIIITDMGYNISHPTLNF